MFANFLRGCMPVFVSPIFGQCMAFFSFETLVRKILGDLAIGSSKLLFFGLRFQFSLEPTTLPWRPGRGDLSVGTLPWSLQSLSFGHGHSFNENLGFGHLAIEVCPICKGEGCFFQPQPCFFGFVFMSIFVSACIYLYLVV